MLLSKALPIFALPLLAAAIPNNTPSPTTVTVTTTVTTTEIVTETAVSQCNTGQIQCCNSVGTSSEGLVAGLLGLLGVVVGALVPIGVNCSPLSVIGVGGTSCVAQPLCCENNTFNGVIAIGCVPIIINL